MKNNDYYEDEISIKDLILRIQDYIKEVLRHWWYPILFIIPILLFKVYKTFNTPTEYTTQTRFLVEGQGGSSMGGLGGLLGSFGINRNSKSNPYKIVEVARSKNTISNVLFSKSDLTNDYLINDIIDNYELNEKWGKSNPAMSALKFTHDSISTFNPIERSAFLSIFRLVVGTEKNRAGALVTISNSDESGVFSINSKTINENITLSLVNGIYSRLEYFFEEKIIEEQTKATQLLKYKLDSLDNVIGRKTLEIARIDDRSKGLISNEASYFKQKLILEIQGLTAAFTETWKNYELADYNLKSSTPSFLLIDQPYLPLTRKKASLLSAIILSVILGTLLAFVFIIGRKIYREVMQY